MICLELGDCRSVLSAWPADLFDSVVTDPPYGLSFMATKWDHDVPGPDYWRAVLRVAKPGAHLVAFGGTRTFHRLTCAIEDAGWEVRDCLSWLYGQGFPKSCNGEWGGTALKPAWEPIVLARKPLIGTVAANVLEHGTGGLNIDACRVAGPKPETTRGAGGQHGAVSPIGAQGRIVDDGKGRWPANVLLDEEAAAMLDEQSGVTGAHGRSDTTYEEKRGVYGRGIVPRGAVVRDSGGASRFFYCGKATRRERGEGNDHPTVKPLDLMRWLVRLVTPAGGVVLDPFMGSGSTGIAAVAEGRSFVGIDLKEKHMEIARRRFLP